MLKTELKSFFVGSLLGDGHIGEKNKNTGKAGYIESHSYKQKEYLEWKERLLVKNLNCETYIKDYVSTVKGKKYKTCYLVSKHSKYFGKLRSIWYKNNTKILPVDFVRRHFNAMSLAIWFLDDGHIAFSKNGSPLCMEIATYNFTLEEVKELCEIIYVNFGITVAPRPIRNGKYFRIRTYGKEKISSFIEIILPFIPKSMLYKVDYTLRNKVVV